MLFSGLEPRRAGSRTGLTRIGNALEIAPTLWTGSPSRFCGACQSGVEHGLRKRLNTCSPSAHDKPHAICAQNKLEVSLSCYLSAGISDRKP